MPMKVREVIRLLEEHGWAAIRSKGSHRHFKHPSKPSVITVSGADGKELAPGTLNDITVIIEETGTVGDTKEETLQNFQEALAAHFGVMREIGEPIPESNSSVDYVEVAA